MHTIRQQSETIQPQTLFEKTLCSLPFACRRAPEAQSITSMAVNPGVVSSNPSFGQHSFRRLTKVIVTSVFRLHQWANSLCGKAASCFERLLCGLLVYERQETHA